PTRIITSPYLCSPLQISLRPFSTSRPMGCSSVQTLLPAPQPVPRRSSLPPGTPGRTPPSTFRCSTRPLRVEATTSRWTTLSSLQVSRRAALRLAAQAPVPSHPNPPRSCFSALGLRALRQPYVVVTYTDDQSIFPMGVVQRLNAHGRFPQRKRHRTIVPGIPATGKMLQV